MAQSRTKTELIHQMNEIAPLEPLSKNRQPYIEELMDYTKKELKLISLIITYTLL